MADKTYWEGRQEKKYLAGEKLIQQYYKDLEKSFEQSKDEIQSIINNFYVRYADENGVSFTAAQKSLSNTEIGSLKAFINKVNASMGKYDQELNNMSIKARITRYQALLKQIDANLQQLYSIEYGYKGRELLKDVYSDSYYRTWYNIDVYSGFHSEYAQINPGAVEELINYPFNGADFSSRIWKQKDHMLQMLSESITTMIVQGKNPNTLSKDFAKKFGTKEYEAYRLLHTEGSFIIEQASQRAYQESGVEKYQWLATLDLKTCELCRPLDGKVFDVGKGIVGETLTPRHMFCRCTTVPYYDDISEEDDTRITRDPVTGKNYEVPADMTYEQWHKQYVASNPKASMAEKKSKNYYSDSNQYKEYRSVLGDKVPKSIDDFQELKYNNSEYYNFVKLDYSRRKRLIDNPELRLPNASSAVVPEQKFTKYLFGGNDKRGLAKGNAFSSRLGYSIDNWEKLQKEISIRAPLYPVTFKQNNGFGDLYEQKIIIYGLNEKPANVVVGWICENNKEVRMTSTYVKEVKE